ncbi:uncharacterized protein [Spinacia oleracea]|uniref:Reverse transcriptase domain-containing protein n=1 Tax=Spinacia oleracea TaxID=3562 RepID=A0A9R0KDH8_SPIOL|nr:uncharacterized protein LOC110805420 [Spinacia oleracea]
MKRIDKNEADAREEQRRRPKQVKEKDREEEREEGFGGETKGQKAKESWAKGGDENSAIFYKSIRARVLQNSVYAIHDMEGNWVCDEQSVVNAFLQYYQKLLGSKTTHRSCIMPEVVAAGPVLTLVQGQQLITQVTGDEVKVAMFSINGDKAPGPDGFGSLFIKENWHIVSGDVTKAVLDFFKTGKLLKEINSTTITLIPKTKCPSNVTEFRPISCCNVIYKCITKILCERMKVVLPELIAENQGAFVHGRFIMHNIMICQEVVRQYGRKNASPSCLIKLDMQKAYDTIEWGFLEEMLLALGFPAQFIKWILGDSQSILMMLQSFKIFSDTSGLKANVQKSAIYAAGVK